MSQIFRKVSEHSVIISHHKPRPNIMEVGNPLFGFNIPLADLATNPDLLSALNLMSFKARSYKENLTQGSPFSYVFTSGLGEHPCTESEAVSWFANYLQDFTHNEPKVMPYDNLFIWVSIDEKNNRRQKEVLEILKRDYAGKY